MLEEKIQKARALSKKQEENKIKTKVDQLQAMALLAIQKKISWKIFLKRRKPCEKAMKKKNLKSNYKQSKQKKKCLSSLLKKNNRKSSLILAKKTQKSQLKKLRKKRKMLLLKK